MRYLCDCVPFFSTTNEEKGLDHGLINYMDTNAKFRHLKNYLKRAFPVGVYLSEATYTTMTPYPPPPFTQGRGRANQREA
jgi:hypothetical protein